MILEVQWFAKENQEFLTDARSVTTTKPSSLINTISESFQWGTVWPCTSSDIKNTSGQSWKFLYLPNES